MKKVLSNLGLFIVLLMVGIINVKANTINSIEMDVYIDENGNASITEIWDANLTEGTEGYRPYTNLGSSVISNFSVSDETGTIYTSLSNWNISASFDSKAYKSGINQITNGVELCWGISKYGNKTYTLKYDISNFVKQYTDAQGIYFNFINLDQSVGNVIITIHSDIPFSLDNSRIWAFGNNGTINFKDGSIVLKSGGRLSTSQYMVALVRFEENIFNVSVNLTKSFDDVYKSAMSDVEDSNNKDDFSLSDVEDSNNKDDFSFLALSVFIIIVMILIYIKVKELVECYLIKKYGGKWLYGSRKPDGYLNINKTDDMFADNKINYYRNIPCDGDLGRAYWLIYNYKIVTIIEAKQGIIGAILLKWIKEEKVFVIKPKEKKFNIKDNNYAIDLSNIKSITDKIENELLIILKEAAGSNQILEASELKKWCKDNYKQLDNWFENIIEIKQNELELEGLIYDDPEETSVSFGRKKTIITKNVSEQLKEEVIQLAGLRKFLLDFSLMPEREYFQVHIWENYLIFAHLLGIADKVEEQFSKIYPKFQEESKLNFNITTSTVRDFVSVGYSEYTSSVIISNNKVSHTSSSDGGGGSSFSSGGSSAGGSSGGGFR